jgi:hypothetical protein
MPIQGLIISDLTASGKKGMSSTNTMGLELHNVRINAEKGPAFCVSKSQDTELDNVSSPKPLTNTPVIRIDSSKGAIVRNCKAFQGTDIFLSTGTGQLKDMTLSGNVTSKGVGISEDKDINGN